MSTEIRLTEHLTLVDGEVRCRCGHVLGPGGRNFKLGTLVRERPLTDGNPTLRDPSLSLLYWLPQYASRRSTRTARWPCGSSSAPAARRCSRPRSSSTGRRRSGTSG